MKKIDKAVLLKHLESKVLPVEEVPHPSATIIDAMGLMNKLRIEHSVNSHIMCSQTCSILATEVTESMWCLMCTILIQPNLQNAFSVVPQKE